MSQLLSVGLGFFKKLSLDNFYFFGLANKWLLFGPLLVGNGKIHFIPLLFNSNHFTSKNNKFLLSFLKLLSGQFKAFYLEWNLTGSFELGVLIHFTYHINIPS